jgi:dephospho-CoA kinase
MIVLGLAGQSGTGKTTVAAMLVDRGAACLDMDLVAREIVEPGRRALGRIGKAFGEEFLLGDGTLNRRKLGRIWKARGEQNHTELNPRRRE